MQPGLCFLQSPIFCKTVKILNLHHLQYFYNSFLLGSENENKFDEINISDYNFLSLNNGNDLKK